MSKQVAIVGFGLMGRLIAWQALAQGYRVSIFSKKNIHATAAFAAGGMLAPFSELENCDEKIFRMGLHSLNIWQKWFEGRNFHRRSGSLILAHPRDMALYEDFKTKTLRFASESEWQEVEPASLEGDLAECFSKALFFPKEQDLNPTLLLDFLANEILKTNSEYYDTDLNDSQVHELTSRFDYVLDARGLGAKDSLQELRGVRGEALLVQTKELSFNRPIRLLHPRYALYIVPRHNNTFYLGATQLETEDLDAITLRSGLELLSAAYAIHPIFGEAKLLQSFVGLRPAFNSNEPRVIQKGNLIHINGLFRHGYLLAPFVCQLTLKLLAQTPLNEQEKEIFLTA